MATQSMLDSFLTEILNCIKIKDGHRITDLIQLDFENLAADRQKPYADLNRELNQRFPRGNDGGLSTACRDALPQQVLGGFHSSFSESLVQYFRYLRDFTTADNQSKALEIRRLTSQCITALGDTKYGVIMIPIVLSFSRVLAKIATNLDRNPSLLRQTLQTQGGGGGGSGGSGSGGGNGMDGDESGTNKLSFVESTANVLRDAFIKCLAGSPGSSRMSRPAPDDKRYGIYLTANSCLKLLFQCRKIRNAQQMFTSIDAQSPPLSFYPAAQRVTYLYYLGRYHFGNSHFYRAQIALQAAYDQCHREARKHRRLILIYLISSNLCLGRFPSARLFALPEAQGLDLYFLPLCKIIRSGDLGAFEAFFKLTGNIGNNNNNNNNIAMWLLKQRVLLQLQNRCEVLTWRSLIRKVFLVSGFKGEQKKIPFLRLPIVQAAARLSLTAKGRVGHRRGSAAPASLLQAPSKPTYVDPEFADMDRAAQETGYDWETGTYNDEMIGHAPSVMSSQMDTAETTTTTEPPLIEEVESWFLSLIQQGFLRGFVLHSPGNLRFAIPGSAAAGGPVAKGFPNIWETVVTKASEGEGGDVVPGWIKEETLRGSGGSGLRAGGMLGGVVRLSGARPVGVGS